MKISARNVLKGKVTNVVNGPVSAEVTIDIAPGIQIVSVISNTSAKNLGLAKEPLSTLSSKHRASWSLPTSRPGSLFIETRAEKGRTT
jgi:molybdopterin-binding protein